MRVRVLPRDLAARIITGTIARTGWMVGAGLTVLAIPVVIESLVLRGRAHDLPLPIAMLMVILLGIVAVIRWQRTAVAFAFVAVAAVASLIYEIALLTGDPLMIHDALYVVNRPTLALVAVTAIATTPWRGVLLRALGLAVAVSVSIAASVIAGVAIRPGVGPLIVFLIAAVAYLTLAGVQWRQRKRVPNFDALERETEQLARGEDLARRTTAAIHDTVLNDLAIVMATPGRLTERAIGRLRDDIEQLRGAEWLSQTSDIKTADTQDASLRHEIMRMVNDFQWRGLSIHVTGSGLGVYRLAPEAAHALYGSVRAALENVLRHSGASIADLEIIYGDVISVMITDQGVGFDPSTVPSDRLGIRGSIVERLEAVGGSARIWSSPGDGTSIMITVPYLEAVSPEPESTHREHQ